MERILFRTEIGRELTWNEVDNNFRYVCNPWIPKVYEIDEIVYNTVDGKISFYKANTTTSTTFISTEWDNIGGGSVSVFNSTDNSLLNYISTGDIIKVGEYVLLSDNTLYLRFKGTGTNVSDYIKISDRYDSTYVSTQTSLSNYLINEFALGKLNIGDTIILNNNSEVWLFYKGFGDSVSDYMRLSTSVINWVDVVSRPISTPTSIDSAVSLSHTQNTDLYVGYGTSSQTSSNEIRTHIDDKDIHFTQKDLLMSVANLDMTAINTTNIDNVLACSTPIQQEVNGLVDVQINGLSESSYGLTSPCYFSNDGGITARTLGTESIGDLLYWNSSIAGYPLLSDYKISFKYLTPVPLV